MKLIFVITAIAASESMMHHHQRVKDVEQYFKLPDEEKIANEKIKHDSEVIREKAERKNRHREDYDIPLSPEQRRKLYLIAIISLGAGAILASICCFLYACLKDDKRAYRQ